MLGFVFCQAVIELCFGGLLGACSIGEIAVAIGTIPILDVRIAGTVRVGIMLGFFVLARRGIGARRRSRRGCRCRSRLNARAGAWRGIGVYRAAGDCEGHGVAESRSLGTLTVIPKIVFASL